MPGSRTDRARAIEWAQAQLGSRVTETRRLSGGWTSTMLALTTEAGARAVLRLMTNEPWRSHGAQLTTREHETQLQLADTDVAAPRSLALDAEGSHAGEAAHLMSLLPGDADLDRVADADLEALARTLALIHDVAPAARPRTYQSWAWPAKFVIPEWARRPDAWERAFAILEEDPPAYEATFLHRDFQPRNVLWTGEEITGVVDWVETSWGPAWLDVAHCRTNLAIVHGTEVADRFGAAYQRLTAREPQPYFDVMDVVGFLPPPGRRAFITDADELARLEAHLISVL